MKAALLFALFSLTAHADPITTITQPTTPEECAARFFSPPCNTLPPNIEAPPIEGTYIRPPWNGIIFPPIVIIPPTIEIPFTPKPPATVPEPWTIALVLVGLLTLRTARREAAADKAPR